jgi:hypothetical protein
MAGNSDYEKGMIQKGRSVCPGLPVVSFSFFNGPVYNEVAEPPLISLAVVDVKA